MVCRVFLSQSLFYIFEVFRRAPKSCAYLIRFEARNDELELLTRELARRDARRLHYQSSAISTLP